MRIESGLSGYSYQSRYVPNTAGAEDVAPETSNASAPRASGASTFSSTLLSNQLASALWTVEGSRKAAVEIGANQNRSRFEEAGITGVTDLTKDDNGIWRGRGQWNGKAVTIGLDFRGNISAR